MVAIVACLLAIKYPNWASKGQIFETSLAYLFCVVIIVLTFLLPIVIHFNKDEVRTFNKSKHLQRFQPLYEELNHKHN